MRQRQIVTVGSEMNHANINHDESNAKEPENTPDSTEKDPDYIQQNVDNKANTKKKNVSETKNEKRWWFNANKGNNSNNIVDLTSEDYK